MDAKSFVWFHTSHYSTLTCNLHCLELAVTNPLDECLTKISFKWSSVSNQVNLPKVELGACLVQNLAWLSVVNLPSLCVQSKPSSNFQFHFYKISNFHFEGKHYVYTFIILFVFLFNPVCINFPILFSAYSQVHMSVVHRSH